jgi:phosphatidylinositol-4,5-bisphosphate 3-kinase
MLILEEFIMLCGSFRETLLKDISVNNFLFAIQKDISEEISGLKDEDKKNEVCQRKFKEHKDGQSLYPLPEKFTFPHDSRLEAADFKYKSCKIMNSKKEPLWIEGINSVPGAEDLKIMFKSGDDLRQDILTLQLIKIMDKMWLDQGLDYKMKPYRVMATMDQVGFIEIVKRSQTTARIHKMQGGRLGALRENTIKLYLEKTNPPGPKYEKARETFKRSCAAYCIATYIMGIGDRHSDNIMVSDEGHLFHIDFGHFLGNFKTKMGINRERSAFVFQREMGYVIGIKNPDDFDDFLKRCTTAYNIIRKNANIFVNVFLMMISAGMPELRKKENLNYLTKQLSLDLSEQEASEKFKKELIASLNDTWRSVDNLIHNLKRQ